MTINIQQALRPLFITYFLIGLGPYPKKVLKPKIGWIAYKSVLYSLIVWSIYSYLLYYIASSDEALFRAITPSLITVINIVTTITTLIINVYYDERFWIALKKFAAVDDTLEKLGTAKRYQKMHMWSKRIVIGWLVYCIAINCADILWWQNRKDTAAWAYVIPPIINHCRHVNAFVDLLFITYLHYIGNRFDKINEQMRYLLVNEEYKLRHKWKKHIVLDHRLYIINCQRLLWSSMHLHLELCHIARELNMMFGTQMTFEMASYLIFLTVLCYYLYKFMQMQNHREKVPMNVWFNIAFWGFGYVARLYAINYMCESVSVKANQIDKIIHLLSNIPRYAYLRKEIHQFTLQMMHHPLRFTGMGLFYFGNQFLRKFFMTIVTFVIIILQTS